MAFKMSLKTTALCRYSNKGYRLILSRLFAIVCLVPLGSAAAHAQDNQFIGAWHFASSAFTSDLVIQPNGQYVKANVGADGAKFYMSGPYNIYGNPLTLRLNIKEYFPNQFCGPLGCTPIPSIAAETYTVQFPNGSTMVLYDGRGTYAYTRVQ
jgi:hypothetical protein